MNIEDGKKRSKGSNIPVFKAPQGNVKGIGKMGQYTGGLDPTVVKPTPGVRPGQMAATILRGAPGGRLK
jgi:hypothetical protein